MGIPNRLFQFAELVLITACFAGFVVQLVDIYLKYEAKTTIVVAEDISYEKLHLPVITVCPGPGWKTPGKPINYIQMAEKKFKLEEMFINKTVQELKNTSAYHIREIATVAFGYCYTIRKLDPVIEGIVEPYLFMDKRLDLILAYHEKHEESWMFFGTFPDTFRLLYLHLENLVNIGTVGVDLQKKHLAKISHKKSNCRSYSSLDYSTCMISRFVQDLQVVNITCRSALIPKVFDWEKLGNLPLCQTERESNAMLNLASDIASKVYQSRACPLPCERYYYIPTVTQFHKNTRNMKDMYGADVGIWHSYQSLRVESKREEFVYDMGDVLAAVGGNMGLWLGFSCLSLLLDVFGRIKQKAILKRN